MQLAVKVIASYKNLILGEKSAYDFGQVSVLKEYSGVNGRKKLHGRYQHGWFPLHRESFWSTNALPTFVWNRSLFEIATERGWKNFYPIGSGWLYFLRIMHRNGLLKQFNPDTATISELWVYGSHSNALTLTSLSSVKRFVQTAIELGAPKSVVLLYYLDYILLKENCPELFTDVDIRTLGFRRDSLWADSHFFNLYYLLLDSKKLIINYPSSILCYAGSLSIPVKWHKDKDFEDFFSALDKSYALSEFYGCETLPETKLKRFSLDELGAEFLKSPEEIRSLLYWNSGFAPRRKRVFHLLKTSLTLPLRAFNSRNFYEASN
jgi:hypothetical protein